MGANALQSIAKMPLIDADTHYIEPFGLWTSRASLDEALAPLTEEERRKVLCGNAAKLYALK